MTSVDLEVSMEEALAEWPNLDRDHLRSVILAADPCPDHPGRPHSMCVPCSVERIRTDEERQVAERRAVVGADLDQRLPARFRCATTGHAEAVGWARGFLRDPAEAGNLLIIGQTGTGKTHMAAGIVRRVAPASVRMTGNPRSGARFITANTWAWWNVAALATALRPGGHIDPQKALSDCCAVDLLVLDDLGTARVSEWVEENLYVIINERYETMRPTVITTNLIGEQYKKTLGERITSRLGQVSTAIALTERDYRSNPVTPPAICPAHGITHGGAR